MKRNLTCIICPRGCALRLVEDGNGITVTGNTCPKGEEYAIRECTNPVRTVTSTVRVSNRKDTMVSVKTETPVPKGRVMEVMAMLRSIRVEAPVAIGDILLEDACGARIVATRAVK